MADNQPAQKPGKPLALIVFFAVATLNVVAGIAGLTLVYKSTVGYHYPVKTDDDLELAQAKSEVPDEPVLFTMEPMTLNLGGTPQRMIRLEMSLVMLDPSGFEEIMGLGARARDVVMSVLSRKTFSDIESLQGKLFLKDQIALALNTALHHGVVKDVFFTDFVIQ